MEAEKIITKQVDTVGSAHENGFIMKEPINVIRLAKYQTFSTQGAMLIVGFVIGQV